MRRLVTIVLTALTAMTLLLVAGCAAPAPHYVRNGAGYQLIATPIYGSATITFTDEESRFVSDWSIWPAANILIITDNTEAQNVWSWVIGHDINNINERIVTAKGWGVRHIWFGWSPTTGSYWADIQPY